MQEVKKSLIKFLDLEKVNNRFREEIDKFKNRFLENDRHFLVIFLLKMNLDIVFQKVFKFYFTITLCNCIYFWR